MSVLGSYPIAFPCPKCKHEIKETVARLKQDPTITCPSCNVSINVKADNFRREMEKAEKAIDDFLRGLKF